jgi:hypothetical protein
MWQFALIVFESRCGETFLSDRRMCVGALGYQVMHQLRGGEEPTARERQAGALFTLRLDHQKSVPVGVLYTTACCWQVTPC